MLNGSSFTSELPKRWFFLDCIFTGLLYKTKARTFLEEKMLASACKQLPACLPIYSIKNKIISQAIMGITLLGIKRVLITNIYAIIGIQRANHFVKIYD